MTQIDQVSKITHDQLCTLCMCLGHSLIIYHSVTVKSSLDPKEITSSGTYCTIICHLVDFNQRNYLSVQPTLHYFCLDLDFRWGFLLTASSVRCSPSCKDCFEGGWLAQSTCDVRDQQWFLQTKNIEFRLQVIINKNNKIRLPAKVKKKNHWDSIASCNKQKQWDSIAC